MYTWTKDFKNLGWPGTIHHPDRRSRRLEDDGWELTSCHGQPVPSTDGKRPGRIRIETYTKGMWSLERRRYEDLFGDGPGRGGRGVHGAGRGLRKGDELWTLSAFLPIDGRGVCLERLASKGPLYEVVTAMARARLHPRRFPPGSPARDLVRLAVDQLASEYRSPRPYED